MPVPPDIREAVRSDYYAKVARLNSRSVFDARTNMARARVMMMLNPDKAGQPQARGSSSGGGGSASTRLKGAAPPSSLATATATPSPAIVQRGSSKTPQPQSQHQQQQQLGVGTASVRGKQKEWSSRPDEMAEAKSKFDIKLMQRLNSVETGIHRAELMDEKQQQTAGAAKPPGMMPALLAAHDPIRKQFITRNALDAAIAVDPRAAEKKRQMMMQQQQQQQQLAQLEQPARGARPISSSTAATAISPSLVRRELEIQDDDDDDHNSGARHVKIEEQRYHQQQRNRLDDDHEEDDGRNRQRACDDEHDEDGSERGEKAVDVAERARRAERRRERIMSERPVSPDDLRLHSTSAWVQRCVERRELEDDEDDFTYRLRLKQRDETFREKAAIDRYKKGSMKPPGGDSMLKVGAAGFFRPVTLLDSNNDSARLLHQQHLHQHQILLPALPSDVSQMSACDGRRHRLELKRSRVMSAEREKMIGRTGAELLEASRDLVSEDWSFAHSRGPQPMGRAGASAADEFLQEARKQQEQQQMDDLRKGARKAAYESSSSSSSSSPPSSAASDGEEHSDGDRFALDSTADPATRALGQDQKRKFDSAMISARGGTSAPTAGGGGTKRSDGKKKRHRHSATAAALSSAGSASSTDHRAVQEALDLLESATVCACEMIVGGLNDSSHRTIDATVIQNILKRALVVLAPRIRRAAAEAKGRDSSGADAGGRHVRDDVATARREEHINRQLLLLRTWVKGCEVWVAMELGLDSHAGFFSVVDAQHLKEFSSLFARTKQIAERNTQALMSKWQQQRDILTDPATLMSMSTEKKRDGETAEMTRLLNGGGGGDHQHQPGAAAIATLPAALSHFFTSIRTGATHFGDMTLNAAARETSSKYFSTLQKFGVLPMPVDPAQLARQKKSALSHAAARLRLMLRRFAHADEEENNSASSSSAAAAIVTDPAKKNNSSKEVGGAPSPSSSSAAAAMVNVFHASWMRSVTGSATPAEEVPAREATVEAHDTVMVLDLFISLLGAASQQYIRQEIQHALDYFHHDTALSNNTEKKLVEPAIAAEAQLRAHTRKEKDALRSVHAQLLRQDAEQGCLDHERLMQLRRAIDKTDSWIHVAEDSTGIVPRHLSTQCGRPNSAVAAAMAAAQKRIQSDDGGGDDQQASDDRDEDEDEQDASGKDDGSKAGADNKGGADGDERSVAEERARATALQKLAQIWKQLYVPFQYRMEQLEKFRDAPTPAVLTAEQRYTECMIAVTKRESLIAAINEFQKGEDSGAIGDATSAASPKPTTTTTTGGGGTKGGVASAHGGSLHGGAAALRSGGLGGTFRGGSSTVLLLSGGLPEVEGSYQAEAEARRARTQRKQQLLADFNTATQMCDAAMAKLAAIGEQLFYHQVLYSVKMKDDLAAVLKILKGNRD